MSKTAESSIKSPDTTLLAAVAADHWGQVAVAWYDTGRLVAIAPWLAGHQARLDYLCRNQRPDGGWGGPDGYAVVPTLSATSALLAELHRAPSGTRRERLVPAVTGGLRVLRHWLDPDTGSPVPDTIGVELLLPALVQEVNDLLHPPGGGGPGLPDQFPGSTGPLPLPDGFDRRLLEQLRARFAAGPVSPRLWACLEVFGAAAARAPYVRPAGGAVGCSAAATAAWLGGPDADPTAVGFLHALQQRGDGPVPAVTPITFFEAAWVLNSLALGGVAPPTPAAILDRLDAGLTADGAPAAPGLPADGDDTAAVLSALLRYGRVRSPDSLLRYRTGDHFTCFPDERNPSVSTNAHVLEAFALYLTRRPDQASRYAGPAATAAAWLLEQQDVDGSWSDKWHASPYYATACCVLALTLHGGAGAGRAVRRAAAWVRQTQRPDGSWGRWQGTVEETAYAVQVLAAAPDPDPVSALAVQRGAAFLADPPPLAEHPPLWHAKDLYTPVAVVQAARLAALRLAGTHLAGTHPAEEHPAGEHPAGEHPAGEHPAGEHPAGEYLAEGVPA